MPHPNIRPVTFAKQLKITGWICPQRMIVNTLASITVATRIEKSTIVFLPAITQVKCAGQYVRQVVVRGQIQNMQLTLVFAALPYAIEQKFRVLGRDVVPN